MVHMIKFVNNDVRVCNTSDRLEIDDSITEHDISLFIILLAWSQNSPLPGLNRTSNFIADKHEGRHGEYTNHDGPG